MVAWIETNPAPCHSRMPLSSAALAFQERKETDAASVRCQCSDSQDRVPIGAEEPAVEYGSGSRWQDHWWPR